MAAFPFQCARLFDNSGWQAETLLPGSLTWVPYRTFTDRQLGIATMIADGWVVQLIDAAVNNDVYFVTTVEIAP